MVSRLIYIESGSFNAFENLALEELLLERCAPGECILYLWQNARTVVLGRNQNAWRECLTERLAEDGGVVARRLSGGGAVFHDLGNLNFTFVARRDDYSVERQLAVIQRALQALGVPAEKSGRNDLVAGGRKFSGNAFYEAGEACFHHGTLMVNVEVADLSRYLSVSRAKLAAKGVASVESRVANLVEFAPGLTVGALKLALRAAFEEEYGLRAEELAVANFCADDLAARAARFASWDWVFGRKLAFQNEFSQRFEWGEFTLELAVGAGKVEDAAVYSDALDLGSLSALPHQLRGMKFGRAALLDALERLPKNSPLDEKQAADLRKWFTNLEL